jgi:hypothetical protein
MAKTSNGMRACSAISPMESAGLRKKWYLMKQRQHIQFQNQPGFMVEYALVLW